MGDRRTRVGTAVRSLYLRFASAGGKARLSPVGSFDGSPLGPDASVARGLGASRSTCCSSWEGPLVEGPRGPENPGRLCFVAGLLLLLYLLCARSSSFFSRVCLHVLKLFWRAQGSLAPVSRILAWLALGCGPGWWVVAPCLGMQARQGLLWLQRCILVHVIVLGCFQATSVFCCAPSPVFFVQRAG